MPDLDELMMSIIDHVVFRCRRIVGSNRGQCNERAATSMIESLAGINTLAATRAYDDISLRARKCGLQTINTRVRNFTTEFQKCHLDPGLLARKRHRLPQEIYDEGVRHENGRPPTLCDTSADLRNYARTLNVASRRSEHQMHASSSVAVHTDIVSVVIIAMGDDASSSYTGSAGSNVEF